MTCDICDFMSHQKPASIIFVTKYVTFMLDLRVIYVTHVTDVTGVTYMICYKYDPTKLEILYPTSLGTPYYTIGQRLIHDNTYKRL